MMNMRFCYAFVALASLAGCCRFDFTVRKTDDQSCVFKARTSDEGSREFLLQYDADRCALYSYQNFSTNGLTSTIRKYRLSGEVEAEWNVPFWLGDCAVSAIQNDELYYADYLPTHGKAIDNLRVFDLSASSRELNWGRSLMGVMPAYVGCRGIMPIGKRSLLLELINTSTLVPSIAIFDCQIGKITKEIGLRSNGSEFVWSSSSQEYQVAVSPDRSRFLLRDENGWLSVYDEGASKIFSVKLSGLLGIIDKRVGADPLSLSKQVMMDWGDDRTIVLWSDWDGYWWHFDVCEQKIVNNGKILLRKRTGGGSAYCFGMRENEEIRRILGRNQFLIKGFDEGVFSKEGYIVTINPDGTESRRKIGWGTWPKKMLTQTLYFAEEF